MKILVFGATSAIAQAVQRQVAVEGGELFLVARDESKLNSVAADLKIRGAKKVGVAVANLTEHRRHAVLLQEAWELLGEVDVVLVAHGVLGDQKLAEQNFEEAFRIFDANFLSAASLSQLAANRFEKRGRGVVAVIGSVAGDRGRQSNYFYGASKGGLATFLQGLRNRMVPSGVHVLLIKPGFVDTPMTATFKKNPLFATPDAVASGILRAIAKKKDEIYLPWFWWGIMFLIRSLPERLFKRLKL